MKKMNGLRRFYYSSRVLGVLRRIFYRLLQKIYKFDPWHISALRSKPYAVDIIEKIEEFLSENNDANYKNAPIVEIGCGRGDIIGNIKYNNKIGIDADANVIKAAKFLNNFAGYKTNYINGKFDAINFGKIKCLIMVNFIHGSSPEKLKNIMSDVLNKNDIQLICFDAFTNNENTEYKYSHDGAELLGSEYRHFYSSKDYSAAHGALRHIEYFIKN